MSCSTQGLRQRIRHSYEARWRAEKHFDEEEIMQELPNSLRTEVGAHAPLLSGSLCWACTRLNKTLRPSPSFAQSSSNCVHHLLGPDAHECTQAWADLCEEHGMPAGA